MPQYEYEILVLTKTDDKDEKFTTGDIEKALNKFGKQGFSLAGIRQGVYSGGAFHYPLAILERKLDKEAVVDDAAREEDDNAPSSERPAYEWDEWEQKKRT